MVRINGEEKQVDGMILSEFLQENGYNLRVIAVELNEKIVNKSDFSNIVLHDGDRVEIVSFVGGG